MSERTIVKSPGGERQFRRMAEAIPQIVWAAAVDGRRDFVNGRWCAYTGLSVEQSLGSGWLSAVHPDDRRHVEDAWAEAIRLGLAYEVEYRLRRADGVDRWFLGRAELLVDDDDQPVRWFGTATDIDEQKRSDQAALLHERQRLTLALAAGGLGIWEWEVETGRVYWSAECYVVMGMQESQFNGSREDFARLVHPEDAPRVWARVKEALDGGRPYECDFRVIRPDGAVRWLYNRGTVARNESGAPLRLVGVVGDITERKEEEERLRVCEERHRLAADAVQGLIYDYDVRNDMVHRSTGLEALVGFRPDEVPATGGWWHDRIHSDDLSRLRREAGAAGDRRQTEYRVRHRNGHWVYVRDHSVFKRDANGTEVRIVGNTVDVTAQRHAEARLRDSERKFRATLEDAPVAVTHTSPDGRLTFVNRAFCQLVGYTAEELRDKTWQEITHPDDLAADLALGDQALAGMIPHYTMEKRYCRKDGEVVWVNLFGNFVRGDDGRVTHGVGVAVDITERKRAEERLQQQAAILDQMTEAVNITDDGGTLLYTNAGFDRMFGYGPGDLLGESVARLNAYPPEENWQRVEEILQALDTAGNWQGEVLNRRKDGSEFVTFASVVAQRFGQIRRFISVQRDITESKEANQQLRESEERLRLAQEAAGLGIHDFDVATSQIRWDERVRELWGVGRDEPVTYELFISGIFPDDRGPTQAALDRALDPTGDGRYRAEYRVVSRRDGVARWVVATGAVAFKDGRAVRLIGTVQDVTVQRAESEARHASEAFARHVSDVAPSVMYVYDLDQKRNVWGNRGMFDGLGYSREQLEALSGNLLGALMHPDDFARYPKHADSFMGLQDGEAAEFEYRIRAADGSWKWLVSRDMVFRRTADGRVTQILGAALDITERKNVEEALREQERRFRGTFDNAAVGIAHVGLDGRWLRVNDQICAITGYHREELLRLTFTEITHPQDVEVDWAQARRLIAGEIDTYTLEKRYVRKDGSPVPIELTVALARSDGGQPAYFISVIQDITERNRSEKLLRDLVERCPFGIYLVDSHFHIVLVNLRSQEGAFKNVRPLIGRDFAEAMNILWPPEIAAGAIEQFRHTLETGEVYRSIDFVNLRQDIDVVEAYEWELHRVTLPDGQYGVICYYFDSTRLRQAEQALKEADRRKDEFLAMLGHELRNPLGPIRNAVQILHLIDSQEEPARTARELIERQVTHMARLVDDLLDVSRVAQGKIRLRTKPCDLAAIVQQTAEDHRLHAVDSGLSLEVDVPDRPLPVNGDPTRLAQIVSNLLHNAVKFTDRGGRVTVRAAAEPDAGMALISVRDTGIGIESGVLARVFEPFAQADRSLDRSRGGLGLGLALVKGLVELHGGTVAAHSDGPGQGSTLIVRLPLTEGALAPAPQQPTAASRCGLRVLVIEDNQDAAMSLRMLLTLDGHQVETASDGSTGVRLARELRPQVVLCDIGLPGGMDGYAVARALRAEPGLETQRLFAFTGYGQEEDVRLARDAGFDQHLVKPVDPEALMGLLRELDGVWR